jgi:enoyl-CoA hydratase
MEFENVLVETDGPVATITLNRPEKLNALSEALRADLHDALVALNPGDQVRVIRLKGAGRAFCPGYDLSPGRRRPGRESYGGGGATDEAAPSGDALADFGESGISTDRESLREMVDSWLWMWNYRKPIIAQTHSYCLSGGLDLIGTCDIVFAAEGTRFGHPAARGLGIPPIMGMLPMKIGAAATKELLFTGDLVDAQTAKELGIIQHVVPAAELDQQVMALCQRIAMMPLDLLTVHKHATNRWMELQGVRTAASEGADFDSIAHLSPAAHEFSRRSREEGLRSALTWRDAPYAVGPAAEHDAANRQP